MELPDNDTQGANQAAQEIDEKLLRSKQKLREATRYMDSLKRMSALIPVNKGRNPEIKVK